LGSSTAKPAFAQCGSVVYRKQAYVTGLYIEQVDLAPEVEDDFNEWYNVDHLPKLAAVPGVHGARRYRKLS